jgi:cyclophilin family peptidyl-prolyl cis-trans isomerase
MAATEPPAEEIRMIRHLVTLALALVLAASPVLAQQPKAEHATITMENGGEIMLEFWPDVAPNHVKNFLELIKKGFYDGQRVHRVAPKFVVQFGDPQSKTLPMNDPKMGSQGSGKNLKAEFNQKPFTRGVLGMARTDDPDSASSQVYIMLGDAPHLNGQYTAFGKVTKGMEVVDKIRVGDRIKSIKTH